MEGNTTLKRSPTLGLLVTMLGNEATTAFLVCLCIWNYQPTIDHLELPITTSAVAERVCYGDVFTTQPEDVQRKYRVLDDLIIYFASLNAAFVAMNVFFQVFVRTLHWVETPSWAVSMGHECCSVSLSSILSENHHSNSRYSDTYSLKKKEVGVQTIEEMLLPMKCPSCVERTTGEDAVRKTSNDDLSTASGTEDSGSSDSELEEIHTHIYGEEKLKHYIHEVYRGQSDLVYLSIAKHMSEDRKEGIIKHIQKVFPKRRFQCTDQASYSDMEYLGLGDCPPHIPGAAAFGPGCWLLNIDSTTVETVEQHRLTGCSFPDAHAYFDKISIHSEIAETEATDLTDNLAHLEVTDSTYTTASPDTIETASRPGVSDPMRALVDPKPQKPYFGSLGCFVSVGEDLFALTARHIIPNDDLLTVAGFSTEHKVMLVPEPRANQQYSIDFADSLIIADEFKGLEDISQGKMVDIALIGPLHDKLTKNPNHISMRDSRSKLNVYPSDLGKAVRRKKEGSLIKVFKVGAVTGFTRGVILGATDDGMFTVTSYTEDKHHQKIADVDGQFAKRGDSGALVLMDNGELPFTGLGIIHKTVMTFPREERTFKNVVRVVSLKHSLDSLCIQNNIQNPRLFYHYYKPRLEISYHKSRMHQTGDDED